MSNQLSFATLLLKILKLLLVALISISSYSQTVKGFIYDAETTVKGAKLVNTTQDILAYSDGKGYFEIAGQLNDTLVVSSYFHKSQTVIMSKKHFDKDIVIELNKITNELDEVDITKMKEKQLDTLSLKKTTAKQGQIAFKEHVFGSGENLQPTLDILKLARQIGKLFKKEKQDIPTIKTADLITIFETSSFFNDTFLRDELGISEVHEYLFFEYIQVQHIHASLLSKDNEFLLLDKLLEHGKAFNTFLTEHQND